jgi:hypothetical protein
MHKLNLIISNLTIYSNNGWGLALLSPLSRVTPENRVFTQKNEGEIENRHCYVRQIEKSQHGEVSDLDRYQPEHDHVLSPIPPPSHQP